MVSKQDDKGIIKPQWWFLCLASSAPLSRRRSVTPDLLCACRQRSRLSAGKLLRETSGVLPLFNGLCDHTPHTPNYVVSYNTLWLGMLCERFDLPPSRSLALTNWLRTFTTEMSTTTTHHVDPSGDREDFTFTQCLSSVIYVSSVHAQKLL